MNKKLQNMLEETLTKNMHLQKVRDYIHMLEETLTKNMHLQKVRDYYIQRYEQEITEYVRRNVRRNTHQEYALTKVKGLFQF